MCNKGGNLLLQSAPCIADTEGTKERSHIPHNPPTYTKYHPNPNQHVLKQSPESNNTFCKTSLNSSNLERSMDGKLWITHKKKKKLLIMGFIVAPCLLVYTDEYMKMNKEKVHCVQLMRISEKYINYLLNLAQPHLGWGQFCTSSILASHWQGFSALKPDPRTKGNSLWKLLNAGKMKLILC